MTSGYDFGCDNPSEPRGHGPTSHLVEPPIHSVSRGLSLARSRASGNRNDSPALDYDIALYGTDPQRRSTFAASEQIPVIRP